MEKLRVFVPIDKFNDTVKEKLPKALHSYVDARENLIDNNKDFEVDVKVICPDTLFKEVDGFLTQNGFLDHIVEGNDTGYYDFCSQVNYGLSKYDGEWFSILEFDDMYSKTWFNNFAKHLVAYSDVSVFLPVNMVYTEGKENLWSFGNEGALAASFSDEIGFVNFDALNVYSGFSITGGIISTKDFKEVGGLKPSIKVAFAYELLLRLTKKKYKVYVIPKIGYTHVLGLSDSLTERYSKELSPEDIRKWFELAKKECKYKEDRNKDITKKSKTKLK